MFGGGEKILKKPKEMLGGSQGGSRTSQERKWTKVQKQSFAAGLRVFKCAPGLWSQSGLEGGGGKQVLILVENERGGCEQVCLFPVAGVEIMQSLHL